MHNSKISLLFLYLLTLTPGVASHVITNLFHADFEVPSNWIVAGFMFDLAWGTLIFIVILLSMRWKKYLGGVIFLFMIALNVWAISNILHLGQLGIFIPYQSLLEYFEFQDVGPDYFFYGLMQAKIIIGYIIPTCLFGYFYFTTAYIPIRKRSYFVLFLVLLVSHGYANNNSKSAIYDSRVSSIYNFAFFTRNETLQRQQDPPSNSDLAIIKKALGHQEISLDPVFPLYRKTDHTVQIDEEFASKKNVIIIAMESVPSACVQKKSMPFLKSLKKRSLFFENYYSPAQYTQRAHFNILHSTITIPSESTADVKSAYPNLIEILYDQGYRSYQFDAARRVPQKAYFYQKNGLLQIKFGGDIARAMNPEDTREIIDDETLYNYAYQQIPRLQEPYLVLISTMTTHGPYYFPESTNRLDQANERSSYLFADQMLKRFIEKFDHDSIYKDTLLIITSDTATGCSFSKYSNEYDSFFKGLKVPLLVYLKGMLKPRVITTPGSHADLAPTILHLLGYSYYSSFLGRSLLEVPIDRVVLFNKVTKGLVYNKCAYIRGNENKEKILCPSNQNLLIDEQLFGVIDSGFRVIHYLQNTNHGRWEIQ